MSAEPSPRERLLQGTVGLARSRGIGGMSLRQVAEALGTSHRMLIYHFGSHEGLLAAVVATVEAGQRSVLADLARAEGDPWERSRRFWAQLVDVASEVAPLFFELSGQALQGRAPMTDLLPGLVDPWLATLALLYVDAGMSDDDARVHARLGLAAARGLLLDLAATGDRAGVDAAVDLLAAMTQQQLAATAP